MRVLVTGGAGLLGRTTCAALAARGHDVVALQRHRSAELDCELRVLFVHRRQHAGERGADARRARDAHRAFDLELG